MNILFTYLRCFLVGGAICALAQLIINYTKLTAGKILVFFMLGGIFLQAFGLYSYIIEFGQAGATVAEGAIKGARTQGLFGAITGGLSSASAGVTSAIVFSFIFSLIFKPKSKIN